MSSSVDVRPKKTETGPEDGVTQPEPQVGQTLQRHTSSGVMTPRSLFHTDPVTSYRRHCVLLNNGVWMPMIGLGICKGDAAVVGSVVEAAVTAGYRYIETSHAAHNEAAIGNALRQVIAAGKVKREDLFIATKLPCEGNRREKVRKYLRSSLKKLQVPFVDLYLVHFPVYERAFKKNRHRLHAAGAAADEPHHLQSQQPQMDHLGRPKGSDSPESPGTEDESAAHLAGAADVTDILETWRGMEDAANMGMTRSIGLCNFNKEQVARILRAATIKPAALQVECHAYLNQSDLLKFCKEHSICLTAYAPLGSPGGSRHHYNATAAVTATGTPSKEEKVHEGPHHSDLLHHEVLRKMADTYKKTPAQILIRWLLQRGIVALPRATCPNHIRENIEVFDFELSQEDVETLSGLDKNLRLFTYNVHGLPNRAEYPFK
ncbi:1,5-anhydro-D-fructose reductase-like [Amblyomma americanum]